MGQLKDLTSQSFDRLTVTSRAPKMKSGEARWHCSCSCGGVAIVAGSQLRSGKTRSCGCLVKEINRALRTTHGHAGSAEYNIWQYMIKRCENVNERAYPRYGGRGISVCAEWRHDFVRFLNDVGPRPGPEFSIDRIDNDGNYEPGNVRWATAKEQANNRRTARKARLRDRKVDLLSEINRLNARLTAAHEALAIDEFDDDSCTTLEGTIQYAINRYRLVCESEAEAAAEIARLRAGTVAP